MNTNNRFTLNTCGDEVTDTQTGLTWKRCFEGQAWKSQTLEGTPIKLTWDEAMAYTVAQTDGWRLPTVEEFRTLLTSSDNLFHGSGWAWSITPYSDCVWAVGSNGGAYWGSKHCNYSIRLVRDIVR